MLTEEPQRRMGALRVPRPTRDAVARTLRRLGVLTAAEHVEGRVHRGRIRAVNYHDIAAADADGLRAQCRHYAARYDVVDEARLRSYFDGSWRPEREALAITFDDGFRSHAEVAAPILEEHGLTGWFFVPTALPDLDRDGQLAIAGRERVLAADEGAEPEFATWDQWRRVAERHVVGSHTQAHLHLGDDVSEPDALAELSASRATLERELGRPATTFCWCGGRDQDYSAAGARAVAGSGFTFAFMTCSGVVDPEGDPLQLHRTNIEAGYSLDLVRFLLAGAADLRHRRRRSRINELTRTTT